MLTTSVKDPRIVFCADLQARPHIYRGNKELLGDDVFALQQVVDFCDQHNIEMLILGGDQVDSPTIPDSHVVTLRGVLSQIPNHKVWFINGNHEGGFLRLELEGGPAAVANNLEVLPEGAADDLQPLTIDGPTPILVKGFNFRTRRHWEEAKDSLLPFPHFNGYTIGVIHGLADQCLADMRIGKAVGTFDLDWFDGHADLFLMGDLHKYWEWVGPKGTKFVYPGSMWMHKADEPLDKYFLVIGYNESGEVVYDKVSLKCRPFLSTVANSEEDLDSIEKTIVDLIGFGKSLPSDLQKPRVHLSCKFSSEALRGRLDLLGEKVHLIYRIQPNKVEVDTEETVSPDTSLRDLVGQFIADDDDPGLPDFIVNSVEGDVADAISEMKKKLGVK